MHWLFFYLRYFFSSEEKSNLSCAAWLEVGISGSCVSNLILKSSIVQFQWFLFKDSCFLILLREVLGTGRKSRGFQFLVLFLLYFYDQNFSSLFGAVLLNHRGHNSVTQVISEFATRL